MQDEELTIEKLVERIREAIPDIRPNGEDDWDWTWADEGFELLESGDVLLAERKFQELILAQPDRADGYEGLALACRALGRRKEALVLIEHACALAQRDVESDLLDRDVLHEIHEERREIESMPEGVPSEPPSEAEDDPKDPESEE